MELLHKAAQAGFRKVDVARSDTDLHPLRGRADFKQSLADLEAKNPPLEVAPAPRERK